MDNKPIYKCINPRLDGESEYYVVPIHTDYTKRHDYKVVVVAKEHDVWSVWWDHSASQDLLDDENFYAPAGEVGLEAAIIAAVRKAVEDGPVAQNDSSD